MVSTNSVGGGGRNSLIRWGKFLVVAALVLSSGFFALDAGATISSIDDVNPVSPAKVRGTFNITWTATGAPGDFIDIYYSTNDFATSTKLTVEGVAYDPGTYSWNSVAAGVANGSNYKVKVKSTTNDVNGISATAFMIDNTPPTTTAAVNPNPADGTGAVGWYKTIPTITLNCSDSSSGCNSVFYKWEDEATFTSVVGNTAIIMGRTGIHTLSYYSTDLAVDKDNHNNQEGAHDLELKVDTSIPEVASYTLNGSAGNVYFNPSTASPVSIVVNANEDIYNWISLQIVDAFDASVRTFQPGAPYDGTSQVVEGWDGRSSISGPLVPDGVYRVKVYMRDD